MTIKSDVWIRSKCMPPTFYRCDTTFMPDLMRETPTWTTKEKLDEELNSRSTAAALRNPFQLHSYREPTAEELAAFKPMIEPFSPELVRKDHFGDLISYGTSSYGYDIRCGSKFKVFTNINNTIVDPKNFDISSFVEIESDHCIIPPNSFALASTVEYFRIPKNVLSICLGKSTYARCGIVVNVTPLEPEWEGFLTLEFSNTTPLPAKIYAGEGCAQLLFFESDEQCATTYKDRKGKYQGQESSPVPPKV